MSEKWPVSSSLTILGKRMKQVLLSIEDDAYEKLMGMLSLCPSVKVESVEDCIVTEETRDLCAKIAFETLLINKVIRRPRDYAWIMMAMGQKVIDDFDAFHSHQDYIDYLTELGIQQVPSRSTLFNTCNITLNNYPEWEFLDDPAPCEALRRKNIIKQFLSAYRRAKRES
jgi:hypothetical protein